MSEGDYEIAPNLETGLTRRHIDDIFESEELAREAEGYLSELQSELDQDSSEDELKLIYEDIYKRLNTFGVNGINSKEEVLNLWQEFGFSTSLIYDLMILTTSEKQHYLSDPFSKASFSDMKQVAGQYINPYQIRVELVEKVVPNLINIGMNERQAYKWAQSGNESQAFAARFMGWLLGQKFMGEFAEVFNAEVNVKGRKINSIKLAELVTQEVERQLRIHQAGPSEGHYDLNISYQHEAYKKAQKTISEALNMSRLIFFGDKL